MMTSLLQDRQGFLWIGTFDGLARFDGIRFTVFKYDSSDPGSIPHNYVKIGGLLEDREGRLWVGTFNGLAVRDPSSGAFRSWTGADQPDSLSHNNITALAQAADGSIWVGTEVGLNRLDPDTGRVQHFHHTPDSLSTLSNDYVSSITVGTDGAIWVGTFGGVDRIDPVTRKITRLASTPTPSLRTRSEPKVSSLLMSRQGLIWVGFADGRLASLNPDTRQLRHRSSVDSRPGQPVGSYIWSMLEDREGAIWLGYRAQGLGRFDPASDHLTMWDQSAGRPDGLSNSQITALLEDRSGNLWVGSWDGLNMLKPSQPFYTLLPSGAEEADGPRPRVSSVLVSPEDSSELWVGTLDDGLSRLRLRTAPSGELFSTVVANYRYDPADSASIGSNRVSSTWAGAAGQLWVSTMQGGISALDLETGRFRRGMTGMDSTTVLDVPETNRILEDRHGDLWVGTATSGLIRRVRETGIMHHYRHDPQDSTSLPSDAVWTLWEDSQGRLWIGTLGAGLVRFYRGKNTFRRVGENGAVESDRILTLREDGRGRLWIGTMGAGVYSLDLESGRIEGYDQHQGLPGANVTCVLPARDGDVWLGTGSGLARLDPDTGVVSNFGLRDGLPSLVFQSEACDSDAGGRLFFGTSVGLVAFLPRDIEVGTQPSPVVITDVQVLSHSINLDSIQAAPGPLVLSFDKNFLSFDFAALDYTAPERNRYRHRLVGVDSRWSDPGEKNSATYPRLNPGRYTFEVMASNSAGIWNKAGPAFDFRIRPPFWMTWWFATVTSGGLCLVVYRGHQYRVRRLLLVQRTRQSIADDLHDEVGSRLGALALALDVASQITKGISRVELAQRAEDARGLLSDLRDTVWVVDGKRDGLAQLVERVRQVAESLLPETNVIVNTFRMVDRSLDMETRKQLLFSCKEILHNISRHADASNVHITVATGSRGAVELEFSDDGRGFDQASPGGRGLSSIRRRLEGLGGTVQVGSSPGLGTRISLKLIL